MSNKSGFGVVGVVLVVVAVAVVIFLLVRSGGIIKQTQTTRPAPAAEPSTTSAEPAQFRGNVRTLPTAPPPDPDATPEIIPEGGVD